MGKQSTLGKFWGKPVASADSAKTDGEKKEEDKNEKATPVAGPSQEVKTQVAEKPEISSTSEFLGCSAVDPSQLMILSDDRIDIKASKEVKTETSKKKRRIVESDEEEEVDGDVEMKAVSQEKQVDPSQDADEPSPERPKKRAKEDSDTKAADPSAPSTVKEIRQEIKETAKAQIDQIKEAPESNGTTAPPPKYASKPTLKTDAANSSKPESKNASGKNPFSLAKAKTTESETGNGKAAAAGVPRKTKGKGKRDPDDSEDEKPSDKNYQPADEEEEEHDSERDAEVSEKEDGEPEEEEEDVDDQEEEKSAKVAASKL